MKRNMKIGIIGTGNIGAALTRHFTRLEHEVVVANSRGPETLADLAKETGAKPVSVAEVPHGWLRVKQRHGEVRGHAVAIVVGRVVRQGTERKCIFVQILRL